MGPSINLGSLAGNAQDASGNTLRDMAGGAPPTAQNPGGTMGGFDQSLYGFQAVVDGMEALADVLRAQGDDPSSAKVKQMAATLNSMRAAKIEKANKLKAELQGAMLGVG